MSNPFRGLTFEQLLDIPPLWLLLCALGAWFQAEYLPLGPGRMPLTDMAGGMLVGGGLLLMLLAALEMRKARTTVVPHQAPDALVTEGIFRRTRNPIYIGDLLILAGLCLRWAAWPSLVLVPVLWWILDRRFVRGEEARLQAAFGAQFQAYAARSPRWM